VQRGIQLLDLLLDGPELGAGDRRRLLRGFACSLGGGQTDERLTPNGETHEIPGWDRQRWAVRGVKDRDELTWTRESTIDVTVTDGGTLDTFAPELFRVDRVSISEDGAAVHVGEVAIRIADDAYITPGEARKLAEALVELADYAEKACGEGRRVVVGPGMLLIGFGVGRGSADHGLPVAETGPYDLGVGASRLRTKRLGPRLDIGWAVPRGHDHGVVSNGGWLWASTRPTRDRWTRCAPA
jgi:hypothetical protein